MMITALGPARNRMSPIAPTATNPTDRINHHFNHELTASSVNGVTYPTSRRASGGLMLNLASVPGSTYALRSTDGGYATRGTIHGIWGRKPTVAAPSDLTAKRRDHTTTAKITKAIGAMAMNCTCTYANASSVPAPTMAIPAWRDDTRMSALHGKAAMAIR